MAYDRWLALRYQLAFPYDLVMKPPLEVEQKYRVPSLTPIQDSLDAWKSNPRPVEFHCDTYLRHPSRDFASTGEALRIRCVNGRALMTYKGPRQPGSVKIRPEIEIPFADQTLEAWSQIWQELGFGVVAEVRKQRIPIDVEFQSKSLTIMLDDVEQLGNFVEIEILVDEGASVELAQATILDAAQALGLTDVEPRSYLRQLLELPATE